MAYSFEQPLGTGSLTNFSFTFPYISRAHITVTVAGVNTAFTWVNDSTIQLASAPANGVVVEIRRTTPKVTALVNFVDAAVLTEADLDTNTQQLLYIAQEAFDAADNALLLGANGTYDAGGLRITNVATPTVGTDAANRDYVVGIAMGSVALPVDAVNITNAPAGTVAATTVQAAINELDSEKLAKTGGVLTGLFTQAAGADIASAATIDLTAATGNSPRITGTAATSAVTMNVGQWALVVANDAWPLTYHATTNKLNTAAANYTLTAGDRVLYNKDLSGVVHGFIIKANGTAVVGANAKLAGDAVQVVNTQTGVLATTTAVIPDDNTIPQNTEGAEFMTLAITPTNAANYLKIDVVFQWGFSAVGEAVMALFQDTTADALAVTQAAAANANGLLSPLVLTHYMLAGTASITTFKVRAGGIAANTLTFNGKAGAGRFGGRLASSITITEIKA